MRSRLRTPQRVVPLRTKAPQAAGSTVRMGPSVTLESRMEVRMADGLPGVEEEGGRGLLLVSALADKPGVAERNPGKIVWCGFDRG